MATQQTQTMGSRESFLAVRDHMMKMAKHDRPNTKVPAKEGLGSTRVPDPKEAPKKTHDREVPGRTRALDPSGDEKSDKARQRKLDNDDV